MQRSFATLAVTRPAAHVVVVELARPGAANAINTAMGRELTEVFEALARPDAARCVVLTGQGERAFCAGGDLKERRDMSDAAWQAQHLVFERMAQAVLHCPIPVIAAVNGAAYGGGCELALLADFAYAADTARFALTEVTLGIMPGTGGTQTLARALGTRRALELLLTGKPIDAREALDWGLVNAVHPPAALADAALAVAARIAANAPLATRAIKQAVVQGAGLDLASAMALELECYGGLVGTQDRREGVLAFNERRQPVFHGR